MNILVWQIVVAVATMLMLFLRWQLCCRHHRESARRVVPVRREQRPPVAYVGVRLHNYGQLAATRTVALTTLPMPIRGTVEAAEPAPLRPSDIRFAPPDVALMRRVLDGLRALPESPPRR
jgi:hypothetical protein